MEAKAEFDPVVVEPQQTGQAIDELPIVRTAHEVHDSYIAFHGTADI